MKRIIFFLIFILPLVARAGSKYEVRAVWITTIGGIDWPASYAHDRMGIEAQQQQLRQILDQLKSIHVNTVLLQTRIRATTIYPSDIEPWDGCLSGKPGVSPGYDALQFAIDECHKRGMELHAWVVTLPIGNWKSYGCQMLRRRYPAMVKHIGGEGYLTPEASQTADYLSDICREITYRYDIDGIHLDYIRYPETWRGFKQAGYITQIVRKIHDTVKSYKPWVKISCSPIGKYDNLSRYSARGWSANGTVAQDAQGWLRQGLMDQLYPMMYFQGNNFYPFAIDWKEQSYGRTIVSGLGIYMLHPKERNWPITEIERQLNVTRQLGLGHCYFRAKFLLDNIKGVFRLVEDFDKYPSLIPPMTWAHSIPPSAPTALYVERTPQGDRLIWYGAQNRSDAPNLLYNVYAANDETVDIENPANLIASRQTDTQLFVRHSAANGQTLQYAITAIDRYGNESNPVRSAILPKNEANKKTPAFIPNDGETLAVPQAAYDAGLLVISDIQGREIRTIINHPKINISSLKDGIYQLRSRHKKGIQHRLGYFIVKR